MFRRNNLDVNITICKQAYKKTSDWRVGSIQWADQQKWTTIMRLYRISYEIKQMLLL